MKKILSLILILALVTTGCGLQTQTGSTPAAEPSGSAEVQTSAPTTEPAETKPVYREPVKTKVEAQAKIFRFEPSEALRDPYDGVGWRTVKLENLRELKEFWGENRYPANMHSPYPSYEEAVGEYDEDFFETRSLVAVFIYAGSGSYRYGLHEVYKEPNGSLYVEVDFLNDSTAGSCDMAGWLLVCAIDKKDLEDVTDYHSYTVNVPMEYAPEYAGDMVRREVAAETSLCAFYPGNWELLCWNAENAQSSYPMHRVDSAQQLEEFWNSFGKPGAMTQTRGEAGSFAEAVAHCNDAFFAEKSLLLTYFECGETDPCRVDSLYTSGNTLYMRLCEKEAARKPDGNTDGWLLVTEVEKKALAGVEAYLIKGISRLEAEQTVVDMGSKYPLDPDFLGQSRVPTEELPLHRICSVQELEAFRLRYAEEFIFGTHGDEKLCFIQAAESFDEAFFAEFDLLITTVCASSDTQAYLQELTLERQGSLLRVTIGDLCDHQIRPGDIRIWFVMAQVPKTVTENVKWFKTEFVRYEKL